MDNQPAVQTCEWAEPYQSVPAKLIVLIYNRIWRENHQSILSLKYPSEDMFCLKFILSVSLSVSTCLAVIIYSEWSQVPTQVPTN